MKRALKTLASHCCEIFKGVCVCVCVRACVLIATHVFPG